MTDSMEEDPEDAEFQEQDSQETVSLPAELPTEAVPISAEPENLDELRRKAAEYDVLMDRLKRVTADFQNTQKRLERQAEERVAYAVERFAEELLPVADNLARAIEAALEHGATDSLLEGVSLVKKQMFDVFKNHGIEMIRTSIGDIFDTSIHDAVAAVRTDRMEPNRIMEIQHHGFLLRGRLLRPARVVVSAAVDNGQGN